MRNELMTNIALSVGLAVASAMAFKVYFITRNKGVPIWAIAAYFVTLGVTAYNVYIVTDEILGIGYWWTVAVVAVIYLGVGIPWLPLLIFIFRKALTLTASSQAQRIFQTISIVDDNGQYFVMLAKTKNSEACVFDYMSFVNLVSTLTNDKSFTVQDNDDIGLPSELIEYLMQNEILIDNNGSLMLKDEGDLKYITRSFSMVTSAIEATEAD